MTVRHLNDLDVGALGFVSLTERRVRPDDRRAAASRVARVAPWPPPRPLYQADPLRRSEKATLRRFVVAASLLIALLTGTLIGRL